MNRNTSAWAAAHAPTGTRWGKKALSLLLGLVLCLLLLPGAAFAADDSSTEEKPTLEVTQTVKVWRTVKDETTGQATGKAYRIKDVPCSDADKSLPETDSVMVGDEITYTITVKNNTKNAITIEEITGTFNGTGSLEDNGSKINDVKTQKWISNKKTAPREDLVLYADSSGEVPITYVVCYGDTEPAVLTNTASVKHDGETYSSDPVTIPVNTETFNLVVEKTWWRNAPDADVTVQLCKDGDPVEGTETVIKPERNFSSNRTVFEDLPLSDFEKYSVREVAIKDATLKETDVSVDIGVGKKLYDVFVTNDKTARWYATYSDELDDDGCYEVYNTYIQNPIEVTKEVTKIVRNGTDQTKKATAGTGDTITYTITIANNTNAGDIVNVVDQLIGGSSAVKFEDPSSETNYSTDDQNGLRNNNAQWINTKESLVLTATYTVQAGDGVYSSKDGKYYLTNTVTVTYKGKTYTDSVKTELEREVYVPIIKTLKNEGTEALKFEYSEDFRFEIKAKYEDEDGKNKDTWWYRDVSFDGEIAAGKSETRNNSNSMESCPLTQEVYNGLPAENGVKYIWIHEVDDEVDRVTYDSNEYKLYLVPEKEGSRILYAVADLDWNGDMEDLYAHAARFTNYYDKQERKTDTDTDTDTVKVGPQLNRDDHTAYIMGYPDGTVRPEGQITRAEACTIFFRLLTDESRGDYFAKSNDYTDVNAGDWYNNAISTLSNAGIVTGYSDGTFRPDQPITRGEMAKIIANFANLGKGAAAFSDLSGHWSKNYVELAAGNGWITGYPDGTFRPDQQITRAETVTMINRVLERVPAKESKLLSRSVMLTFPDNTPGDWYYIAMQEASNSHAYQRSVYETDGDEMWTKLIENVDWTKLEK